jgi:RND family efflux transporter MFP subunit
MAIMPRNIAVSFEDGTLHTYQNVPDTVMPEDVEARAQRDFQGKRVTNISRESVAAKPAPETGPVAAFKSSVERLKGDLGAIGAVAGVEGAEQYAAAQRQKAGEMAAPGMPIVQIINLSNLKIVAEISDSYISSVKLGDPISIKFPDINKEMTARISLVSNMVNPLSRTFEIEAKIPNAGELKPNQLAVININDTSKSNAVIIDENWVQKTEKGSLVYVAVEKNGKKVAEARFITLGLSYNGQAEVLTGLKNGDLIISQGFQDLVDGQSISF